MKAFTKNKLIHKMIIAFTILVSIIFVAPSRTYAIEWGDIGGKILKEVVQFIASIGDVVMGAMNSFMLGTESADSAMLDINEAQYNAEEVEGSSLNPNGLENPTEITINENEIDSKGIFGDIREFPNMLYSPEAIFSNNVGMLDVNFLNPNTYTSVNSGDEVQYNENEDIGDQDKQISASAILGPTIASWYKAFRNIAIVGLLTVLVYLGIKILISSTASDKAKYKESLQNWGIALCLVFAMHFIMAGILTLIDQVNYLFDDSANNMVINFVAENGDESFKFRTNLIGLVRFRGQSKVWQDAVAYCVIYFILVIYTIIFTFQYLKRLLYMAFFTMIAPLVALTYPIDKVGDGKAQAFNMWFKEYTVNAMIQPIHLLLYTALVSSAISLVSANPIYAIVAIGFMIPAEKFIKKMFRVESETSSAMGSFAGGALAMTGLQQLARLGKNGVSKSASGGKSSSSGDSGDKGSDNIKFAKTSSGDDFGSFGGKALNTAGPKDDGMPPSGEPIDERHRILLAARDAAQRKADEERAESIERAERSERAVEELNEKMRKEGYLQPEDDSKIQTLEANNQSKVDLKPNKGWRKRYALARAKQMAPTVFKAAKGTAKTALKLAGGATGAAIGFAAGTAQGDPSKAFTNMAVGAVAGGTIGSNAYNIAGSFGNAMLDVPGKFEKRNDKIEYTRDEAMYGAEVARQRKIERENEQATQKFLSNSAEQEKWEDFRGKLKGYKGSTKDLMNVVADYKKAGVNDDKMIQNALKLEAKYGNKEVGGTAHKNIVDVARFTSENGYGREYVEDEKKRKSLDSHIDSKVADPQLRKQIKKMHAELNDVGHLRRG